jgi:hypothetical protein
MRAPDQKHDELVAEIAKLQKEQLKSLADARFGGWSREEEAAHRKRSDRLAFLISELKAEDRPQK